MTYPAPRRQAQASTTASPQPTTRVSPETQGKQTATHLLDGDNLVGVLVSGLVNRGKLERKAKITQARGKVVCLCLPFYFRFGEAKNQGLRERTPGGWKRGGQPTPRSGLWLRRERAAPGGQGAAAAGGQASLGGHANTGEDVGRPGALPAGCPEPREPHLSLPEEVQLLIALGARLHVHSHPSREARRQP